MTIGNNKLDFLQSLIRQALAKGADAADAIMVSSHSLNVAVRHGSMEKIERSENGDIGIRVFSGKKQSMVSASYSPRLDCVEFVDRAWAMAVAAPEDPYCGLAEASEMAQTAQFFARTDPSEINKNQLIDMATAAEDAAKSVNGVTNTEGADAYAGYSEVFTVNSRGFSGHYQQSNFSLSVSAIAGSGTNMERDYDFTSAVFAADLTDAALVGKKAGENAVRRLNPRKVKSQKCPVVFDPRISNGLLRNFASAINGAAIARGTSFLKQKMGQQIFADSIRIVDDPLRDRGLRTRPFDAEGLMTKPLDVVRGGVLQSWILDCRSSRQLGLRSTGHASRGVGSAPSPSPTNFYLAPGGKTPQQLMADISSGFYVTETMGMGVNLITGDFSQGASGFWIENGQIVFPVSELTIAGHLSDMFLHIEPANDLQFKYGIDAPTLRVAEMTVAGQ